VEHQEDAIGQAMLDHLESGGGEEIVERDDGFIIVTDGPADYFASYEQWPRVEQQAMDFVQGRVLDVGCGAGRGALELQRRGHEVVAIDVSPGAIDVCRKRGVRDARALGIEDINPELGTFDTIVLFGVNLGLLQNEAKATECLHRLATDPVPRKSGTVDVPFPLHYLVGCYAALPARRPNTHRRRG
jgi:SAM-dependent methyltransferase